MRDKRVTTKTLAGQNEGGPVTLATGTSFTVASTDGNGAAEIVVDGESGRITVAEADLDKTSEVVAW